jgi:hypothetical protein
MANIWDPVVRRLVERRGELLDVLTAARERAEHLAVEADAVCRRTSGDETVERVLVDAVRTRDAVDELVGELNTRRARQGTRSRRRLQIKTHKPPRHRRSARGLLAGPRSHRRRLVDVRSRTPPAITSTVPPP